MFTVTPTSRNGRLQESNGVDDDARRALVACSRRGSRRARSRSESKSSTRA